MTLRLRTDRSRAELDPDVGATITDLRIDGSPVLWSQPPVEPVPPATDPSMVDWVTGGVGGWEVMAPNAGAAGRTPDGTLHPFHGAAGRSAWTVVEADDTTVAARVDLDAFRVSLRRTVVLGEAGCRVVESMAATGPDPIPVVWGSHLALGGSAVADPVHVDVDGTFLRGEVDGCAVEADAFAEAIGHLTTGTQALGFAGVDGEVGHARLTGPSHVATVTWDASTFPWLWVWVELEASAWPWGRRARAVGLEPCSSWPASGVAGVIDDTRTHVMLEPGDRLEGWVDLKIQERP